MALLLRFQQISLGIHVPVRASPYSQVCWDDRKFGTEKDGFPRSIVLPRSTVVARTVSQTGGQSLWTFLFPQRIRYSSDPDDVDPAQLSELWVKTLNLSREPCEIANALKHSYSMIAALDQGDGSESCQQRLVGFGRAVSDGAFIATICDVAVDPAYQRRGIGRRIVKELVKSMKKRGGPAGFAVFPPPKARLFFWSIGFRSDRNFRHMVYRGRLLEEGIRGESKLDTDEYL